MIWSKVGLLNERRSTMNLKNDKLEDVVIVNVGGRLDATGAPELEAHGKGLIEGGAKKLLFDMAGVEYISSAGLRSLLVLAKAVKTTGGSLALCSLLPAVKEVMTISGFDSILPLAGDRAAATALLK